MTSSNKQKILIAGAGPVGLATALFLANDGVKAMIVDAQPGPSSHSKALAVNPRTLEILESVGVTSKMLKIGRKIRGARISRGATTLGEFTFESLHHTYPFMLALSQSTTERLLTESLYERGVDVKWNVGLEHCNDQPDYVAATLKPKIGSEDIVQAECLLAADGAHSRAREELGIPFTGSSFKTHWRLVDVPLKTTLPEDLAHVVFLEGGGFLFMIRVIDETEAGRTSDPIWRVMGDVPDPLTRLQSATVSGVPVWASEFTISHRINDQLQSGHVYFAGDAAHIHSPMGARGMNLGIEDAWVFAQLYKEGRLQEYGRLREKVDRKVVKTVALLSRLVRGESGISRLLRATAIPMMTRISPTRSRMIQTLTGLDHPLTTSM